MKRLIAMLVTVLLTLGFAAACDGGDGGQVVPPGALKGTITIAIPIGDKERLALQNVIAGYRAINPYVTVNIETKDYNAYQEYLSKGLQSGTLSADIVQNNLMALYMNSAKFVDYSSYLSLENPYAPNEAVWSETLESPARRPNGPKKETFSLNFETTQMMFFYNKAIFREIGGVLVDEHGEPRTPETFTELISFINAINNYKPSGSRKYIPFAISGNADSIWNLNVGWLLRIYADQYFRNITEDVQSQSGDWSYTAKNAGWEYNPYQWKNIGAENEAEFIQKKAAGDYTQAQLDAAFEASIYNDSPDFYDVNILRLLEMFSKGGKAADGIGYNHPKFIDMLKNFTELVNSGVTPPSYTTIDYSGALNYFWNGSAAITFHGADMFSLQIFNGKQNLEMGTFFAPPMEWKGTAGGEPDVDFTRSLGGPQGFYGVVNQGKTKADLAMDFMMYWASKQGMEKYFDKIASEAWVLKGKVLVRGAVIPDAIYPTKNIPFMGECDLNPIQIIARGLSGVETTSQRFTTEFQNFILGKTDIIPLTDTLQANIATETNINDYVTKVKDYKKNCWKTPAQTPYDN